VNKDEYKTLNTLEIILIGNMCGHGCYQRRYWQKSWLKNRSTWSRVRNGHCFRRIFQGKLVEIIYHVSLSDSHYQPHNVRYY